MKGGAKLGLYFVQVYNFASMDANVRRYPRKFFIWRWQENEENEKANAKRRDMTAMTPQSQHVLPNLILWLQIERQKKRSIFPVQIQIRRERVGTHFLQIQSVLSGCSGVSLVSLSDTSTTLSWRRQNVQKRLALRFQHQSPRATNGKSNSLRCQVPLCCQHVT